MKQGFVRDKLKLLGGGELMMEVELSSPALDALIRQEKLIGRADPCTSSDITLFALLCLCFALLY